MASFKTSKGALGWWILVALLWMILAKPALSRTWEIIHDPSHPGGQIGEVFAQATSGDTLLIGPGHYYEHILVPPGEWTFIGTSGSELTILDGSLDLPDREGSVLYTSGAMSGRLLLDGLAFQGGTGARTPIGDMGGGGVCIAGLHSYMSVVEIRSCSFVGNEIPWIGEVWGGGLFAAADSIRIVDCTMGANGDADYGGCAALSAEEALIDACIIMPIGGRSQGSGFFVQGDRMIFQNCRFETHAEQPGSAILSVARYTKVSQCVFFDHGAPLASFVELNQPPGHGNGPRFNAEVHGNVFFRPRRDWSYDWGILAILDPSTVHVDANTLVHCSVDLSIGGPGSYKNNLVYDGDVRLAFGGGGEAFCNNTWGGAIDAPAHWDLRDNISADPLFCGVEGLDLTLHANSPCLPDSSPVGCGRIGALGVGCASTPVRRLSWGAIRGLYR